MKRIRISQLLLIGILCCGSLIGQVQLDTISTESNVDLNRSRGQKMLSEIKAVLKERYYDKNFKGIDIDARFKAASERIKKLETNWQIFRAIAQVLIEFDDSHTRFYPPNRSNRTEYGFTTQMIGSKCYITDIKKGSDAATQGLRIGDHVLKINQYTPDRTNLWLINYLLNSLDPLGLLTLEVISPGESGRKIDIKSKIISFTERQAEAKELRKSKSEDPYKCHAINAETVACRLETFRVEKKFIDRLMTEATKYPKMILDLRGNRGGYVAIEEYLVGHFFDREVKIADFITRHKTEQRIAKMRKDRNFKGELIVLIDSNSASAAEVFARVIQIEKRGVIVGDVSAGAVMTSNNISIGNVRGAAGFQTYSVFGVNVTIADLIMSDGNRLEKVGVIPDHLVGPSQLGLRLRSDAVLSYAAKMFGADISPENAGKLNFIVKKVEDDEDDETGDEN